MIRNDVVAALDAAARTEMERTKQPGLTLAVTSKDETLAVRTYGVADLASLEPVTPETLFEIGSIGKSFTAILVLQLVDEGRIDLQAPVDRYLPWFRVGERAGDVPITIAHLLSHTAGIVAGIDATPEAAFQVWSLRNLPATSAPGERFHYSNVGYKALGLVLEAVVGRPSSGGSPRPHSRAVAHVCHGTRDHARHPRPTRRRLRVSARRPDRVPRCTARRGHMVGNRDG